MRTLIGIQQQYIDTINAGMARWAHRTGGGHSARIARGARRELRRELRGLGFTDEQITRALDDARDMAALQRRVEVE